MSEQKQKPPVRPAPSGAPARAGMARPATAKQESAAPAQAAPRPRPPREAPPAPAAQSARQNGASAAREQRAPRPPRSETAEGQQKTPRPERAPAVRNPLPPITFPEELPVSARRQEISEALRKHQVVIVCGETGSGKTTQLPKICLELGRGKQGLIGHTQPRRIAASSTAKRIAQELGSPLGEHVGFKVRFTDTLSAGASVKLMTDGILLAETQTDPQLRNYDTLIIDEAHERSLNIDFLLGFLKQLLPRRRDLKLIITSATIDAQRFAEHFAQDGKPAPVIEVSGRLYDVEVRYRPIESPAAAKAAQEAASRNGRAERDLMDGVVDAVDELCRLGSGDVLVFLPGEREIREAAESLRKHHPPHVEILPLFARLSVQEQERVFKPSGARRIVLATNVAETSLTVPGIRYVVDTGLARVKRYSYRNKVEQLQIEPIAQSSANQRAGRCGRVANGVCIRLYDEQDFAQRPRFADPEILRSSLAAVILRMRALRLSAIESFPFIEAPLGRAIADGYQLLQELGALDEMNQLTETGKKLARLPLDPRVGRMILAAQENACLHEVLIIAAALSVQDPRERPLDAQQAADEAHKKFADERSEFMSWLKIWQWFENAVEHKKTNRQLQDQCRQQFLSQLRLREWRDVHSQLLTIVREQGWHINSAPATYEQLHLALLTGLLGNIGYKSDEEAHYLGARGIKFHLWPGMHLSKKPGRWVMAAELVETSRLYARCIAQIQPEWLEKVGAHLLKKSWGEPRWEKKQGQVSASERATLYGLVVYSQRRVNYGALNPSHAREIFIREALVQAEFETRLPFFTHNQNLVREIENLEHKSRRLDVLVDEALIEAFYDQHIPPEICTTVDFEQWYKQASRHHSKLLYLVRDELMRHEAAGVTTDLFPKRFIAASLELALSYHFEPGSVRDGVTLSVPLYALNQIQRERCEWLVPGMLKEKVHLLLKSLPQKLRRHCVPLPEYASGFCARTEEQFGKSALLDALIHDLREQKGLLVKLSDFKPETLSAHHFMNFKVIDEHGRQLEMGRNLAALQSEFGAQARASFQRMAEQGISDLAQAQAAPVSVPVTPDAGQDSSGLSEQGRAQLLALTGGRGAKPNAAQPSAPAAPAAQTAPQAKPAATSAAPATPVNYSNLTAWSFGELPELLEIGQGKLTLIGYPALVDKETHADLEVFDDPQVAARTHRAGLRRLFALQFKDQLKHLEKNIPGLQQMGMQFMSLGSQEELKAHIMQVALDLACMQEPLPLNEGEFNKRRDEAKTRLGLLVNETARLTATILAEFYPLAKKLQTIRAHADSHADMEQQLKSLVHKRFLLETAYAQLSHFPRYLKAIGVRIDKLRSDPARDATQMAQWLSVANPWRRAQKQAASDPQMQDFRWMLEELRVGLFAQELKTPMPVSVKRLQKVWESLQR
ncbi:ATP-dependent RNA helicase HrpA [Massilia sp. W12]|uniref:ATP-dependent RNA helicase HrpA n=1 Tax=Massilia sp. W12 TaxID=3126507 RepID=UPI0030CBE428